MGANPDTDAITGERLDKQGKISENRIQLREKLELETTIEVEVVKLEARKLELELVYQNREMSATFWIDSKILKR